LNETILLDCFAYLELCNNNTWNVTFKGKID